MAIDVQQTHKLKTINKFYFRVNAKQIDTKLTGKLDSKVYYALINPNPDAND